jgi:hypothetical protein
MTDLLMTALAALGIVIIACLIAGVIAASAVEIRKMWRSES